MATSRGKGSKSPTKPCEPDITVENQKDAETQLKGLDPSTWYEPDGITIVTGSEVEAPTRRKKKLTHLIPQPEEIDRFFSVIESHRDRAIFRIMYHAGLRASEVGKIEMRDYQPRTDRLMITRLKGSNSGEHPMNRKTIKALKQWLKVRGTLPGVLFASRKHGPISRQSLDELVKRYGTLAGWPTKMSHCHTFKHACCTHLLSRGFNVEQVRDWVGHENIQNTMIYARVTNARRDEMGKALMDS
jgi:site-specific recombinase XerD